MINPLIRDALATAELFITDFTEPSEPRRLALQTVRDAVRYIDTVNTAPVANKPD